MTSKILIGKPTSQLNDPWYKRPNGATDIDVIEKALTKKAVQTVSYFKIYSVSRGGASKGWKFYKTLVNGYMICIDETKVQLNMVMGIPSPYMIQASNKREYDKHFKRIMKILST